jgi:hypothetical protein
MKMTKLSLVTVALLSLSSNLIAESSFLNDVDFKGDLRTRYENADVDNGVSAGEAVTTRFDLNARANIGGIDGLSTFGQVMAVSNYGFNNYAPENGNYDTIADPNNARITQAYLDYKLGKTLLSAGRQMVNLDDQRFVGAVNWRQMPQTFLAYSLVDKSVENLTLTGAYVTRRYGVVDTLNGGTKTVLLNANYKASPALQVTGYGYLIGSSSDTYGVMAKGKIDKIGYIAEVAQQSNASLEYQSAGKPTVDALYYRADVHGNFNGFIAGVGYESLGKADGKSHGFTAPLSTLHKWQGFADAFLGYTGNSNTYGLNDATVKVGYAHKTLGKLIATYHDFEAQETTVGKTKNSGNELDFLYVKPLTKQLTLLGKVALYNADANSVTGVSQDIDKYMFQVDYKF